MLVCKRRDWTHWKKSFPERRTPVDPGNLRIALDVGHFNNHLNAQPRNGSCTTSQLCNFPHGSFDLSSPTYVARKHVSHDPHRLCRRSAGNVGPVGWLAGCAARPLPTEECWLMRRAGMTALAEKLPVWPGWLGRRGRHQLETNRHRTTLIYWKKWAIHSCKVSTAAWMDQHTWTWSHCKLSSFWSENQQLSNFPKLLGYFIIPPPTHTHAIYSPYLHTLYIVLTCYCGAEGQAGLTVVGVDSYLSHGRYRDTREGHSSGCHGWLRASCHWEWKLGANKGWVHSLSRFTHTKERNMLKM